MEVFFLIFSLLCSSCSSVIFRQFNYFNCTIEAICFFRPLFTVSAGCNLTLQSYWRTKRGWFICQGYVNHVNMKPGDISFAAVLDTLVRRFIRIIDIDVKNYCFITEYTFSIWISCLYMTLRLNWCENAWCSAMLVINFWRISRCLKITTISLIFQHWDSLAINIYVQFR